MRAKDIVIGQTYRHRTSSIGFAQAVAVIPPKTGVNDTPRTVIKCAWSPSPTFEVFLYKYFLPSNLTKGGV